jgi:hypothetical protein
MEQQDPGHENPFRSRIVESVHKTGSLVQQVLQALL